MSNYYSKGSSAYKVAPEQAPVRQTPVASPNLRPQRQGKTKPVVIKDIRERLIQHFFSLAFIFVVVGAGVILLSIDINTRAARNNIQNLRLESYAISHQNETMQVELALLINLQEIEYLAVNYLNMAAPQDFQIVTVDVPFSQIQNISYEPEPMLAQSFSFSRLWNMFFGGSYE